MSGGHGLTNGGDEPFLARAQALIEMERWNEAQIQISRAIAAEPQDDEAHALMAFVCLRTDEGVRGEQAAREAVRLNPNNPFAHFVMGLFHIEQERWISAEECANEVLRLDPFGADGFGLHAYAHYGRRQYRQAVAFAEQGLAHEPNNVWLLDVRTMSMQFMGKGKEARQSAIQRMVAAPDDPNSHRALGWNLLLSGRHRDAEKAFTESLRMDPQDESAREGLLTSLRARFFPYKVVFAIDAFLMRLPSWVAIAAWIGVPQVFRIVRRANAVTPQFIGLFMTAQILVTVLVFLSWSGSLLANATLLFHHVGRYALARQDKIEAIFATVMSVSALIGGIWFLAANSLIGFFTAFTAMALTSIIGGVARYKGDESWRPGLNITLGVIGVLACLGFLISTLAGNDSYFDAVKVLTSDQRPRRT